VNDGSRHRWALLALGGCLLACSAEDRIESRAEHWKTAQPARYVVQTCTIGYAPAACIRAAVEDGQAVAAEESIFDGDARWEAFDSSRSPLDDMFDQVREADGGDCELEDVTYDDAFGFVDLYESTCDGFETGRWVACFEPDTLDLAICDVVPVM
jgi:hypothetical protein